MLKVTFQPDGTSTREQRTRARIQSDAGAQQYGILRFPYQSLVEGVDVLNIRVIHADGSTVSTPPDSIQDMTSDVSREAPFYSDVREKHAVVKGLGAGDRLEFSVRWQIEKPLAPRQFWFAYRFVDFAIVLDEELEVSIPRECEIKIKSRRTQPTMQEDSARRIYSWHSSQLASQSTDKQKEQIYDLMRGMLPAPDVLISSFQSWEEVGQWYEKLQQEKIQASPAVKAKAEKLTRGLVDDDAKLHAIYNYVSLHYRYVGIAFGIGRYQPHSATEILGNQYGDCKDKHTLFAALLSAVGIRAYPALISSQTSLDEDVPSPGQFDHVISVVEKGDKSLWMDTTPEVAPMGQILGRLRRKPALVIMANRVGFQIAPGEPRFPSKQEYTVTGKLDAEGTLQAHTEGKDRGDDEVWTRYMFRRVPQSQWKDVVLRISYAAQLGATISNVNATAPENTEEPFVLTYDYTLKDFAEREKRRFTIPLSPYGLPELKDDDMNRKVPLWLGEMAERSYESRIELPKDFSVEPPPPLRLRNDFADVREDSEVRDGVLITRRYLVLKAEAVGPDQLQRYRDFEKSIQENHNRYVFLRKSADLSATSTAAGVPGAIAGLMRKALTELPTSNDSKAGQAESEARQAMQRLDRSSAIDGLKRAVELDPTFTRAWIELGSLLALTPDKNSAIDAFRKATEVDPKQVVPLKILAYAYALSQKPNESIAVWQSVKQVAPEDPDVVPSLGRLLMVQKRYKEAVALFEPAATAAPGNANFRASLGLAHLHLSETEAGIAAIHRAVELDSSAQMLNNVAYEMAEADTNLLEALAYSQRAVREVEERSLKVGPGNVRGDDLHLPVAIGAYWDTLGWIYYKKGDLAPADSYLTAAWQLTQDGIVADHLGQLYEKASKLAQALRMYALALETNPRLPDTPGRMRKLAHIPLTANRISAGEELSRMRTIKLPSVIKGSESADFYMVIVPGGKIEHATFLRGSELLRDAGETLEKTSFREAFPPTSTAHVLRRGTISCSSITGCTLVFHPPTVTANGLRPT